jgi:hypothetical protein
MVYNNKTKLGEINDRETRRLAGIVRLAGSYKSTPIGKTLKDNSDSLGANIFPEGDKALSVLIFLLRATFLMIRATFMRMRRTIKRSRLFILRGVRGCIYR